MEKRKKVFVMEADVNYRAWKNILEEIDVENVEIIKDILSNMVKKSVKLMECLELLNYKNIDNSLCQKITNKISNMEIGCKKWQSICEDPLVSEVIKTFICHMLVNNNFTYDECLESCNTSYIQFKEVVLTRMLVLSKDNFDRACAVYEKSLSKSKIQTEALEVMKMTAQTFKEWVKIYRLSDGKTKSYAFSVIEKFDPTFELCMFYHKSDKSSKELKNMLYLKMIKMPLTEIQRNMFFKIR